MDVSLGVISTAFKTVTDLINKAVEARDHRKFTEIVGELQKQLLAAQGAALGAYDAYLTQRGQLDDLQRRIREFEEKDAERNRYVLVPLEETGALAYALRSDEPGTPHFLCATCFDSGTKSVLQPVPTNYGRQRLNCRTCKTTIAYGANRQLPQANMRPPRW
jgi:hypothetical protein